VLEPARVGDGVIVQKGDDLSTRGRDTGVARARKPGRAVVGHDDEIVKRPFETTAKLIVVVDDYNDLAVGSLAAY
jgi:hypothetical protein